MGRTPRKREAVIWPVQELDGPGHGLGRGDAADDGVGTTLAGDSLSSSMVSSIEWGPVAAATLTNFTTFHPAASAR